MRISTISIDVGKSDDKGRICAHLLLDNGSIFLHGTPAQIIGLADSIRREVYAQEPRPTEAVA